MRRRQLIDLANEQVSIAALARSIGVLVPELGDLKSYKTHCPFGFLHPDRGMEKAFRVYPWTNTAYCFAGCGYYTPVWLASQAWDVPVDQAAERLLEEAGWKPPSDLEEWSRVLDQPAPPIDTSSLAEALKVACSVVDVEFHERQLEPAISSTLDRCMALLPLVHTAEEATSWLEGCKSVMKNALGVRETEHAAG